MSNGMGLGGVVSKHILVHKGILKLCIKEAPVNKLDNGWRFLSDVDTDEFLVISSNMIVCDWRQLLS